MPYRQVFELKGLGQVHGSTIVDQSVNLGVKGMPGTLTADLFPESLDTRANEITLNRLLLESGTAGSPSLSFRTDIDTGVFLAASNHLAFSTGGTKRVEISSVGTTRFSDGDTTQPGLGFLDDFDTGIYRVGTNVLGIVAGGAIQAQTGDASAPRWAVPVGSASSPGLTFIGDLDTGIFSAGSNSLGIVGGGVTQAQTGNASAPKWAVPVGSASSPGLTFIGDLDTGFFRGAENQLNVAVGGASRVAVKPTGLEVFSSVAGNTHLPLSTGAIFLSFESTESFIIRSFDGTYTNRLVLDTSSITFNGNTVWHAGNDGSGSGLNADLVDGEHSSAFANSGHDHISGGQDGGTVNHGNLAGLGDTGDHTWAIIDGGTTTASANTWFGGARSIKVVSSQLKNKTSISPLLTTDEHPYMVPAEKRAERQYPFSVLDLTPIQFKSLLGGDDGRLVRTGFLWEDVDENYPAGTQDESLDVNALIAGLVAEVKQLRQEVNELKGNHGDS